MPRHVIDATTGTRLIFDPKERKLWAALESSGDSIREIVRAGESFIVAGSAQDIDCLIAALASAKAFFDAPGSVAIVGEGVLTQAAGG